MKLIVEFEWDEKELGDGWFNIDNLKLCLFTEKFTKRELLKIRNLGNVPIWNEEGLSNEEEESDED